MLTVIVWDVQHGNALYIRTPNGQHIVQDLGIGSYGSSNRTFSPLNHLRWNYEVSHLDAVILTHPHRDHLDDIGQFDSFAPHVLVRPSYLTEAEVWAGNQSADRDIIQKYLEINNRFVHPVTPPDPTLSDNNGGVQMQFFFSSACGRSNLNNHSCVTVLSHEGIKIVLPGDNEAPSWQELLSNSAFRAAIGGTDVFLAPHHGRDAGFLSELFDQFRPRLTIVSDGRFSDTSATDRYVAVTRGWTVHTRTGDVERKVVTTRSDGVIRIECGRESTGPFLSVSIA